MRIQIVLATALLSIAFAPSTSFAQAIPFAAPASAGMRAERFAGIRPIIEKAIAAKRLPGCVVCVGRHGKIVYYEAFGQRKLAPPAEPMTKNTLFDMASITKPVVTATCVMKLIEDGEARLGDRVAKFMPEFGTKGKEQITIKHLLIHQSGLIPDNALKDYLEGPETAWKNICELELAYSFGDTFKYSDVNFIVLAKLVERISGKDIHAFSQAELFKPLHMSESGYLPAEPLRERAAPTQQRDGKWMRGEVHDPRAYALGGVAGHAGLFSTATDLAIYAQMMLQGGTIEIEGKPVRILSHRTIRVMTGPHPVSSGIRGLGWDKQTGYSSNRGDLLSRSAFGHGGFTGTVLWIDPDLDLFFIFLSNRVHPDGKGSVNHLAGQVLNRVASAIDEP